MSKAEQAPEVLVPVKDYQDLMRVKREHEKFKFYLESKLADIHSCIDLNTDEDGIPIDFHDSIRLDSEAAELEELLK